MITQTLPIGKLFNIIEAYEKVKFIPENEIFLNSSIKIQDEFSNWIDINAAITKKSTGEELIFDDGSRVKAAKRHLIKKDKECVFLESLGIGDTIIKANGETITVVSKKDIQDTIFYDLSVVSDSHLYQTSNGIVHHNTEAAKQLAQNMGIKLVRFDMSEYQEQHSVSKFIGSPPGYVGFDDNAGQLITSLQETPNCVLLLDEVEKAHPSVLTVLLQLMDNGFITGSNGKKADGRNAILIMTSNLGAADAEKNGVGFGSLERDGDPKDAVSKFFAPEFRNRLDGIIKFSKLDHQTMVKVVKKFISEMNALLKDKNIHAGLNHEAVEYLIRKGFDSKMGARPLQRIIDDHIKKPLSREILFGKLVNGGVVEITVEHNELKINCIDVLSVKEKANEADEVNK